jgi:DNA polymerase-3 subunit gamma/tau
MSYQVLARKWRPQTFEEVTGQETVTKTLQNAIRSGRIAHAFLFSGVRGVGKTTTARILAKALNCHQGPTPTPCGQCVSCVEIANANSVDVLEIDAASNRRIDDVRELRESVRYGTARDRFKIFIIDEVHMLTNEAFNALLKTLEEPPPHVKLILATTERHKIPVTITSRCQQYDFKPIPFALIFERLRLVAREEGIEISDYGLRAITAASQGSMRDAQSTLDRVIAFSGQTVTDQDVQSLLGVVDDRLVSAAFEAILEADRAGLIRQTQELALQGIEPLGFCRKLVEHVRNLMICKVAGWDEGLLNLPDAQKETFLGQAQRASEVDLIRYYDLLNRAEADLRWHPHPAIHLEMTLVKMVELARLPRLEEVLGQMEAGASGGAPAERAPRPVQQPTPGGRQSGAGAAVTPAKTAARVAPLRTPAEPNRLAPSEKPRAPAPGPVPEVDAPMTTPLADPSDPIQHLLVALQRENHQLYSFVAGAEEKSMKSGDLELKFSGGTLARLVNEPDNLQFLSSLWSKISGAPGRVSVVTNPEAAPARPDPVQDPGVRSFMEKFPGKIVVQRKVEN